jgi:hypothetical protein
MDTTDDNTDRRLAMSNADVSRAANSAVDAASAGLEKYFATLHERVVSLLAKDRDSFTKTLEDVHTMLGAVANEQHEIRAEGKRDRGELLSGVQGVAQDISVVASSVQEVTAQLKKHDDELAAIQAWRTSVDAQLAGIHTFDRDALLMRIERIDSILADLPTRHGHAPDAIVDAVIARIDQRAGGRGAKTDE